MSKIQSCVRSVRKYISNVLFGLAYSIAPEDNDIGVVRCATLNITNRGLK